MYLEFLQSLGIWITALNSALKTLDETELDQDLTCYVDRAPVYMSEELCGWIFDDIGGQYHYEEATGPEREWWSRRPWALQR